MSNLFLDVATQWKTFGERVKHARKRSNLTLRELGEEVNLCAATLSNVENGHEPTATNFLVLSRWLDRSCG